MGTLVNLIYGFTTDAPASTLTALVEQYLTPTGLPQAISVDVEDRVVDDDWVETITSTSMGGASWSDLEETVAVHRDTVKGSTLGYALDPAAFVRRIGRVPFALGSFFTWHPWAYRAPGFGGYLSGWGWGAAFQGAGHDRLVSRRWLATGPYRVLRGPNDTTLVQLHDLDASPEEALVQAKASHDDLRLGVIQIDYRYTTELAGLHKGADRSLVFTVAGGRIITANELRDAAAARLLQPFGPDKPIERVVYVFIDRAEAEAQLPLMWRYGHEVHVFDDQGVQRRIDDAYQPEPPFKPAWAEDDAPAPPAEAPPKAPSPKLVLSRAPVALSAEAVTAIERVILADRPDFEPRIGSLSFQKSVQPFFADHTLCYASSAAPVPARSVVIALGPAGKGSPLLLTHRLDNLNAIAAIDRPRDLDDEEMARGYALYGNGWTTTAHNGEMRVDDFDHLPWHTLDASQEAQVDILRDRVGDWIRPEQSVREERGWVFHTWVLADRALIERKTIVHLDGRLEREERVHATALPVPVGNHWGTRDGRWVPVG